MIQRTTPHLVLFFAFFCWCGVSQAGGGPENLVLVVNADSQTSKLIANYYIQLRDISPRNVIYLGSVPKEEVTSFARFKNRILIPIVKQIQAKGLGEQIDYVVYSADFPTAVKIGEEVDELARIVEERSLQKFNRQVFRPVASINALTYFMRQVIQGDKSYISLQANAYMRIRNTSLLSKPFVGAAQERFDEALQLFRNEDYDAAIKIFEPLARQHPNQIAVSYWLARTYAKKNDTESSLKWLQRAVTSGWSFRRFTDADLAFGLVVNNPEFKRIVASMPDNSFEYLPSQGFRSFYHWGYNGMINGTSEEGATYVLSTVLATTGARGTSEREALDQMTRSVRADGTRPKGTFYFTETGDIRTKCRKSGIAQAVEELIELGFKTRVINSKFPSGKRDMIGLTVGTANFDFPQSKNQIMPGAICENLTSFGGRLGNQPGQTPLTEFIAAGAAGSSGTVTEPLSIAQKFPDPRVHVHYVNGCSLAESFYQSVHGPFQLLIVGDALCQPWAVFPKFELQGIEPGETVSGIRALSFDFSGSPVRVRGIEFYMDGKLISRLERTGGFSFNSGDIADGYHELRIVAVAENSVETQGRVIVPFFVSNQNQEVTLERQSNSTRLEDTLTFAVSANCGERIELLHNDRVLAKSDARQATFEVPASTLGRGPVQLIARAIQGDVEISSQPVAFTVEGRISTARVVLPPRPKQPAPPKKPAKSK